MLRNATGRADLVGAARGLVRRALASEAKGRDAPSAGAAVDNLAKFEQQRQATAQDEVLELVERKRAERQTEKVVEGADASKKGKAGEHDGPSGLEPTRFGDWERNARCSDF